MQHSDQTRCYEISSLTEAKVFSHPIQRRLLLACVATPQSMKTLSDNLGYELKTIHYNIGRLCKLGLVKVVKHLPRGGRSIKLYQTISDNFYIPQAFIEDPCDKLRAELFEALEDHRLMHGCGSMVHLDKSGKYIQKTEGGDENAGNIMERWEQLSLGQVEIKNFISELTSLIDKYALAPKENTHMPQKKGSRPNHLLHVSLVPSTLKKSPSPKRIIKRSEPLE